MAQAQNMQLSPTDRMGDSPLVKSMAEKAMLDTGQFMNTVLASCFTQEATPEQFAMFLMIAKEHDLNPLTREIYAFQKGGKVMPIVSIDGWLKIINEHPDMDGMQVKENLDDNGGLVSITVKIFRKDRKHPTEVTEYLDECKMNTEPWKKWPTRMLRHKAAIQCGRYAFGFASLYDPDEAERMARMDDNTFDGTATIVEDEPESRAASIVGRIQAKVAPPEDTQELETVDVEDIPGIKKASEVEKPDQGDKNPPPEELTDEQKEFVADMEAEPESKGKKK